MYDFTMTAQLRQNIMKQKPIFEQKISVFVEKKGMAISV